MTGHARERWTETVSAEVRVLDGVADPLLLVDAAGGVRHLNAAARRFFEHEPGAPRDVALDGLLGARGAAPEERARLWEELSGGARAGAIRLLDEDGSEKIFTVRARWVEPTAGGSGRLLHFTEASGAEDGEGDGVAGRTELLLDLFGTTLSDIEYPLGALRWCSEWDEEFLARTPGDLHASLRGLRNAARHIVDLFAHVRLRGERAPEALQAAHDLVRVAVAGGEASRSARLVDAMRERGRRCLLRAAASWSDLARMAASGDVDAVLLGRDLSGQERADAHATLGEEAPEVPLVEETEGDAAGLADALCDALERRRPRSEAEAAWRRIEEMALRDGLTGVLNRRAFERFARLEFERALRYRFPVSVAFFDLDRFKEVNDEHGHRAGDRLLQVFASYLQTATRRSDLVGRLGGDEFAVLMSHTDGAGALMLTSRLREDAEAHLRGIAPPGPLQPGVSAGLAVHPDVAVQDFEDLLEEADRALYRAKRSGRGRLGGASATQKEGSDGA